MYERRERGLTSVFAGVFRGVDLARRIVINLIFLTLLLIVVAFWAGDGGWEIPDSTALVIAPKGRIVEQLSGDAVDRSIARLSGDEEPETLKRDLERALAAAKDDARIKAVVLELNGLSGAGLTTLQDVRAAIDDFKTSGKPVIANADFYGDSQYYLASAADEIYLHHMGLVILDGYGRFRTYYKEGLDKAEIDFNIFRVGEYKSAVEPYLRDSMSQEAKEANLDWMGDLWDAWLEDVAPARGMTAESLRTSIARFDEHLQEAEGQASEVAKRLGLVDHVGDRDALRDRMIDLVGEDSETYSFQGVDFETYLETVGDEPDGEGDALVAVVVASGPIEGGNQSPGTIGGESTAALIRAARHHEETVAIVLRVNSPGGSAFASEVIRRELVLARQAGKKVVVSMGDVAASGGYWISSASDEIWANANTITGSIGIFGMLPTFQKPLAKHLGTRVDGVGTTWLAGAGRSDRALDPRVADAMQQMVEQGYEDFLVRVGEARDKTREEVDQIARGRVWSGADAQTHGLVDRIGGLEDAIASAAKLAGLPDDDYRVDYLEHELDLQEQLLVELLTWTADWYQPELRRSFRPRLAELVADYLHEQTEMLLQFDDPRGLYAHCLCEVR